MSDIKRKQDHIEITLTKNVESSLTSRFESIQFVHEALPEINHFHLRDESLIIATRSRISS